MARDERGVEALAPDARSATVALSEGTMVSVTLGFRVSEAIDGLVFEETRRRAGRVVSCTRTTLGGYRAGGPYEVQLPAERLPGGRAERGVYEITGRFMDSRGRTLGLEHHSFRLVRHLSARESVAPRPFGASVPGPEAPDGAQPA
ncbi:hypothetical protein ACFU8I_08830 [Streptomyces sp. NPDC057540]|uniref:hypothetical protein n=1 Tax=Streptomyces sp. NPDC057540 TaxID=3346160 RepID=UPI0036AD1073